MLYFICSGRGVFLCLPYEALSLLFVLHKIQPKGDICYLCSHHPSLTWIFSSPIPTKKPIFQPCAFRVIFLILCFSLAIDNLPTKNILLRFRYCIFPNLHVCLSISDQRCCKVKLLYFWVHLNALTTCVIVTNFFWPTIFQDIITNHASVNIVVFRYFLNPDFIGPVTESWSYMLLSLLPE